MKRLLPFLVVFSFLVFVPPSFAFSQFARSGDSVVVETDEVIDQAFIAISGETVEMYGTVTGDLYVAGGSVYVDGIVEGDLIVGGGQVFISGEVLGDVRAAGGSINLDGIVDGNSTIAGGNITLGSASRINGGGLIAGGNVTVQGEISEQVLLASGASIINGLIGGNTEVFGGQLTVAPTAIINGELAYNSDIESSISPNASISAGVREIEVPHTDYDQEQVKADAQKAWMAIKLGFSLVSFLSLLVVGFLMIKLAPNYLVLSIKQFGHRKMATFGYGFVAFFGVPVLAILLFVTVLLAPLGLVLLAIYGLMLYISQVVFSYWMGRVFVNRLGANWGMYVVFIIGLFFTQLIKTLPVFGSLFGAVATLAGLGMLVLSKSLIYKDAKKAKLL